MAWKTRRTVFYLGLVAATVIAFTLAYNVGMATWEDRPQPLYRSLEVVFQSFTTTGYGEDAPWRTPQMNLLAIGMQLAGIGLLLTAVDVFAVPWLRTALTPTVPTALPGLEDHVIVCEYSPRGEAFIRELDARGKAYVLVVSDQATATELHEADYPVIQGDPESTEVLEGAGIASAVALVADATDDRNASIVLSAKTANPDVRVVTLVEDADLAQYQWAAGADAVLSPRQLLGESLAGHLPSAVVASVDEGIEIGEEFQLVELTVEPGSELCRQTVAEARLHARFGVHVIGSWDAGEFESPVDPDAELVDGTSLLVAGREDQLERLRTLTTSDVHEVSSQRVVIAGFGDSGSAAHEALSGTNARTTVLDKEYEEGVDIVGDTRDPAVLREAGIEEASALIIAVGDDTTAIFATLIARELNPDVDILVRANEHEDVEKLYRAGADYVQSLATVSGRMLASTVFDDEDVLSYDRQIGVVRLPAGELAGRTLAGAAVRTETGTTVVAAIRGEETITDLDPDSFRFEAVDDVVVAGTDESITRFERQFGG